MTGSRYNRHPSDEKGKQVELATPRRGARVAVAGASPCAPIDLTGDDEDEKPVKMSGSRKRQWTQMGNSYEDYPVQLAGSASNRGRRNEMGDDVSPYKKVATTPTTPRTPKAKATKEGTEEKRLRRFRSQAPQNFGDILYRAVTQKFFVLERTRAGTGDCPEETVELTGSTGNVYKVHIGLVPRCDCPHAAKGNQCKHTVFVMKKVLHAPDHLVYQLALLSSELRDIFALAPPIGGSSNEANDKNRKPLDDDCPICFSEFDSKDPDSIIWCRAACGQNIHQECFQTWARTKVGDVTCPMCRSVWEQDESMVKNISKNEGSNSEGYVNVASQLGISGIRDTSTYSEWFDRPLRPRGGYSGSYRGRRRFY